MYSRNCGSNCPSSWALIARSTRGSALMGPGPMSRRGAGFRSAKSGMRMVFQPVAGDVDAARHPDFAFGGKVSQETLEGSNASRAAGQPAMQPDRHHATAFGTQDVESVLEVLEELLAGIEALRGGEAHVVRVQRIGNDQLRLAVLLGVAHVVPRQVV